ncbi:MAG: ATP-binding cassette domain-containing protein [Oscillospiraceae bacterium]|nr:ATP-binding cassette domain-containing protein [Oscillospiraceae bacterium]
MLELKNLCVSAQSEGGKTEILKNISLQVESGKFLVVTGPNGGGKTTLARTIMGIMPAESGEIVLDGTDLTDLDITARAKAGVSYAFQQPPRFKGMKVKDLLEIAAGKALRLDESCAFLTQVGLCASDYIARDVDGSLSGGEVKRIEIATILARGSKLMIFDEPEAGIDLWSFARLTETFRQLHARGDVTIIIISHQERIIRLADEVLLIAGGQIRDRGPADKILPMILSDTVVGCNMLDQEAGRC